MRNILCWGILLFLISNLQANDLGKFKIELDVLNRHYWRGMQLGNSPAIEPGLTYSYKRFGFNVWAAKTLNSSYAEIDLIPSYSVGNYTFILYDYFNPVAGKENSYFAFSEDKNRHSAELAVKYKGSAQFPLNIMIGSFVFGDKNPETRKPYYSTYGEFGYPLSFFSGELEIHAGFTPFEGYYAPKAAIVNAGITIRQNFKVSEKIYFPYKFSFYINPHTSKAFLIFGVGLCVK